MRGPRSVEQAAYFVAANLCETPSRQTLPSLATTLDWAAFLAREWPMRCQTVAKKFSGVLWR